jgi:hypothetical protein
MIWKLEAVGGGNSSRRAQSRQVEREKIKILTNDFYVFSPNFAAFAPLREILRVSVAALPRWVDYCL